MIMTMATTKKTRIITVVNHKGGVGKTMTAANLGAALAKMGKTVLLVDADGQCNLTMQSVEEVTVPTLSDYLNNDDIEVNPQQVSKKLFLIPGSTALDADSHNIELSIEEDAGATKYMSEWLEKVKGEYDYVIIDSAPGSGAMLVSRFLEQRSSRRLYARITKRFVATICSLNRRSGVSASRSRNCCSHRPQRTCTTRLSVSVRN